MGNGWFGQRPEKIEGQPSSGCGALVLLVVCCAGVAAVVVLAAIRLL